MVLDNIQAVEIEDSVKQDARLSTNSIRFKQESLAQARAKVRELETAKNNAMELTEKVIQESVNNYETDSEIKAKNIDYASLIVDMEDEIKILRGLDTPVERVDSRAIRLMDKMIKNARANSKGIYDELDKQLAANANYKPAEVTPINMDVEKISEENEEPVKDSIDAAIKEESLEISDIKDVFDKELEKAEEKDEDIVDTAKDILDRDELERKINEKIDSYLANVNEIKEVEDEEEYVPMTDEEIAKAQENIELDKYNELYEEEAKADKEVEEVNAAKEYDFKNMFSNVTAPIAITAPVIQETQLRDEIVVAPEREEKAEEKIEEFTTVEEKAEPKAVIVSADTKEKLKGYSFEELQEMITSRDKVTEELEQKASNVAADIEEVRRMNTETAEAEAEAEKRRAELEAEKEKAAQELKDMMAERVVAIDNKNSTLSSAIQSREEELANINKDTETRREKITSINKDTESIQEEIAKYKEMRKMIFGDESTSEDEKQIVK